VCNFRGSTAGVNLFIFTVEGAHSISFKTVKFNSVCYDNIMILHEEVHCNVEVQCICL